MKSSFTVLTLVLGATVAFADPAPITSSSDIGLARSLVLQNTPAGSSQMGVGGGEFAGTINGYSTLFWCVDDQEEFNFGDSGYGNVTLLSNVAANPTTVKFGGVTNGGNPHWTNTTDTFDSVALPSDAASRFEMAAYLVAQYNGFVSSEAGAVVANTPVDLAIQEAIWSLTNNTSISGGFNTISGNDADNTTDQYWIHQALLNYAGVNTSDWAVVSWATDGLGNLDLQNRKQTFLVQVAPTPEPSTYGFLAAAMAGLVFFARRKQLAPAKG
ncbi:MAG TPA: PEP-CTERM sorting domain-containing protein [Bryobacteraceae bacterium]|nr:PEP-CTERM sorting domain-containing protein [Bryobacteraceae bacterium]